MRDTCILLINCPNRCDDYFTLVCIFNLFQSPEREVSTTEPVCDFCLQTSECNRKGEQEDLLICRDCGNKGMNKSIIKETIL